MRSASIELRRQKEERTDFYPYAKITFLDGTIKEIERNDFELSGSSTVESAESSSFPLGILVPKYITLSLANSDDRWSEYDFYGAEIFLQTKYELDDGKIESFNIGTFTVIGPESYGTTVEITAMDDSYKMDVDYSTNLKYPVTLGEAVRESCIICGVTLLDTTFRNSSYIIKKAPTDLTHRQFIGYAAMIAGGNARFDEYNRLMILTYDFSLFDKAGLDGGIFDVLNRQKYMSGDSADGGLFLPWNVGFEMEGGTFSDWNDYHVLFNFKDGLTVETDDVTITGIKLQSSSEGEEYLYGADGYVLSAENPLSIGQEEKTAGLIGEKIVGLTFRPFTGDSIAYPMAEFMDLAFLIDRKQNIYQTVITDVNFQYYGFTTLKCSADSPIRNAGKYYGEAAKAIVAARQITEAQITEYDRSVQKLTELITQSFGVYKTEEVLEDGSTIYYMHDKPTLSASQTIWKMTADAFAVSTDGGKTWNAGMDSSGNAVVNVLSAIGINADWINTGTLKITKNGKTVFYADVDTGRVDIIADSFSLTSGQTIDSIAEDKANTALSDAKDYADAAAKGAVSGQTQEDIFNKLTNNGKTQGIYMENGALYVNASFIRSGTLVLGGANNGNGKLSIVNSSGVEIGRWDNSGIYINAGSIYSKSATTGASLYGGRLHMTYGETEVGYIGTNMVTGYDGYNGLVFDLEDTGAYMAWAAKESEEGTYLVKLLYANKTFGSLTKGNLYASCTLDMMNNSIKNAYLEGLRVKESFSIPNNVDCDIYSDIDFHNFSIDNVKIKRLVGIEGVAPYTGTLPVVTSITSKEGGGISWTYGNVTIKDGIITSIPSS